MGTILIVEDEHDVRESLREVLEDEGHNVVEASNGSEALAWLRSHPAPSLVLLDLMMPVMNGYDFLDALKKDPALSSLAVVILSAVTREKLEATAKDKGASGFLEKPVHLKRLLSAVEQFR